jgi:hypothetical protein
LSGLALPTISKGEASSNIPRGLLFRTIGRHATAVDIETKFGSHNFPTTAMANYASTRTTQLYDRRHEQLGFDEIGRIRV